MTLPAKALFALIDIKKNLLSREVPPSNEEEKQEKPLPRTFYHAHAKTSVCQSARFWSQFR
jgi:hypothetical protein